MWLIYRQSVLFCPDQEVTLLSFLEEEVLVIEKMIAGDDHFGVFDFALVKAHASSLDEA